MGALSQCLPKGAEVFPEAPRGYAVRSKGGERGDCPRCQSKGGGSCERLVFGGRRDGGRVAPAAACVLGQSLRGRVPPWMCTWGKGRLLLQTLPREPNLVGTALTPCIRESCAAADLEAKNKNSWSRETWLVWFKGSFFFFFFIATPPWK